MKVLVVNAGSSSLKYQLFDTATYEVVAKGICERIGIDGKITHKMPGRENYVAELPMPNHSVATKILIDTLTSADHGCIKSMDEIEAVGHRIVHGGAFFSESVKVTPEVIEKLEQCRDLAPLHTGAHLMGIKGITDALPGVPQVLVFDTAFHQTMPDYAWMYPIPYEMYEKYSIRRYGAHGTSHRYVAGEMCKILGKTEGTKIITCHIGNGSSISAVKDGKVIDTSMGFTPLDGVEMGTRCGSIDPATVCYLQREGGYSYQEVDDMMNKQSGLLAISGISNDARDIRTRASEGDERCLLAFDMFAYKAMQQAGSMIASMAGVDTITFTAGIGENDWSIRKAFCDCFEWLGVRIDNNKNREAVGNGPQVISAAGSSVTVMVIPTDEEYMIAHDVERLTKNN